jgi:hypothetical protein
MATNTTLLVMGLLYQRAQRYLENTNEMDHTSSEHIVNDMATLGVNHIVRLRVEYDNILKKHPSSRDSFDWPLLDRLSGIREELKAFGVEP